MSRAAYLTGQFLLAMPGMGDRNFERAVIAMCAHDAEGAVGIGLGAVIDGIRFHALLGQFGIDPGAAPDAPVHAGGPVEVRRGFLIHSLDWMGQDSIDVAGRWALSGSLDILRAIAGGTGPRHWAIALGYAGWGAGQLDGELTTPGWLPVEGGTELIYDVPATERWQRGFADAGIDPRLMVTGAGTA